MSTSPRLDPKLPAPPSLLRRALLRVIPWYRILGISNHSLRRYFCLPGDVVSDSTILFGAFELERLTALKHLLRKLDFSGDGLLIDVGAHFGLYAVELKGCFLKSILIEANPVLAHVCNANMLWNQIQGEVICAGASNGSGIGRLKLNRQGHLGEANLESAENSADSFPVSLSTLDDLCKEKIPSDMRKVFLKIDVEGLELEVLDGAKDLIKKYRPVIQIEFSGSGKIDINQAIAKCCPDYQMILMDNLSQNELLQLQKSSNLSFSKLWLRTKRFLCPEMRTEKLAAVSAGIYYEGILLVPNEFSIS